MLSFKRKITYFYQYHNGTVGSTAGFLKLEIRGDKVKIIINIQETPGLPYQEASLYFYHEAGDHLAAVKVDNIESRNGILTYLNRTEWQQLFDTGRDLYTFDGVAVVYNENHYFIGDFQDKDRRDYALVLKEKRVQPRTEDFVSRPDEVLSDVGKQSQEATAGMQFKEESNVAEDMHFGEESKTVADMHSGEGSKAVTGMQSGKESQDAADIQSKDGLPDAQQSVLKVIAQPDVERESSLQQTQAPPDMKAAQKESFYEKCENCPYHKKHMEKQEQVDAFEKMLQEYPKLPMYGATELFDCVRIHPKDIGKLDMRNWKLGVNSFLTHGFYTYQYLLLGKMRFGDGAAHPIIGVPGVYSNREKYLANMFGFEQFIPVKKTGVKTGEFGYWIVEISPYL